MVLVVAPMATPTGVLHVGANQVGHGCFDGGREKRRLPVLRNARGGESSMNYRLRVKVLFLRNQFGIGVVRYFLRSVLKYC